MSDVMNYKIKKGVVECDYKEKTQEFISGNVKYLNDLLVTLKNEVLPGNEFTMICKEKTLSFAVEVDEVERGQVANGVGALVYDRLCKYDEMLELLK